MKFCASFSAAVTQAGPCRPRKARRYNVVLQQKKDAGYEDGASTSRHEAKLKSSAESISGNLFPAAALQNRDAKARRQWEARVIPSFRSSRWDWSEHEIQMLQESMLAQLQEDMFRRRYAAASAGLDSIEEKKRAFLQICADLQGQDSRSLLEEKGRMVDWLGVAEKLNLAMATPLGESQAAEQPPECCWLHDTVSPRHRQSNCPRTIQ